MGNKKSWASAYANNKAKFEELYASVGNNPFDVKSHERFFSGSSLRDVLNESVRAGVEGIRRMGRGVLCFTSKPDFNAMYKIHCKVQSAYNKSRYEKIIKSATPSHTLFPTLAQFSDSEIIADAKRRGYVVGKREINFVEL